MIKIKFTHHGKELVTIRINDTAFYVPNIGEHITIQHTGYKVVNKTHHLDTDILFPQEIIIDCV